MITEIIFAFWFFIPAGVANMSPIFANNIKLMERFNTPIDRGKTYRGKRIFGDHKTSRGLLAGVVGGIIGAIIQIVIYTNLSSVRTMSELIDYSEPRVLLLGAALGLGALVGDSVKSFFKRQCNVAPGKGWFPFDQTDFMFGSILFSLPFVVLPLKTYVISIALALALHPITNIIGWLLKMKPRPF